MPLIESSGSYNLFFPLSFPPRNASPQEGAGDPQIFGAPSKASQLAGVGSPTPNNGSGMPWEGQESFLKELTFLRVYGVIVSGMSQHFLDSPPQSSCQRDEGTW